jgi:hypothetical protein
MLSVSHRYAFKKSRVLLTFSKSVWDWGVIVGEENQQWYEEGLTREQHPYHWDTSKPLVIFIDTTDLKDFKNIKFFIDTTRTKKSPTVF